jgi:hypothetical protein
VKFKTSFAAGASPLCRFPFRLHRLLNLQSSTAKLIGWRGATQEFGVLLFALTVRAFLTRVSNTPSADFCCALKPSHDAFSHQSVTHNRSPAISSTAFYARPPDLPPAPLVDTGFAITCSLAQRRRPSIRFLSIGPRVCSTLPSDPTSRSRPCASLPFTSTRLEEDFHL